jgi:hypothetical protein
MHLKHLLQVSLVAKVPPLLDGRNSQKQDLEVGVLLKR